MTTLYPGILHGFAHYETMHLLPEYLHLAQRLWQFRRILENDHVVFYTGETDRVFVRITAAYTELLYVVSAESGGYFRPGIGDLSWDRKAENVPSRSQVQIAMQSKLEKFTLLQRPPVRVCVIFDTPKPPVGRIKKEIFEQGIITKPGYRIEYLRGLQPEKPSGVVGDFPVDTFHKIYSTSPGVTPHYSPIDGSTYLTADLYNFLAHTN